MNSELLAGKIIGTDRVNGENIIKHYTVNLDPLQSRKPPDESQINIYTDGSLAKEHAGSGYTIPVSYTHLTLPTIYSV